MPTTTTATTTTPFGSCAAESDACAHPFGFAALYRAWQACRRGKRGARPAQRYEVGLLDRLADTSEALRSHAWRPARASRFIVRRPKAREILAPAYGDRVVHHLLVPWLERHFEPVFIADSFANRKGRGSHAAVRRLQQLTRRQGGNLHYLQLDIANFFNSIQRRTLFGLLRARLLRDLRRPAHDPRHARRRDTAHMLWLARRLLTGNPAHDAIFHGRPTDAARVPTHKQLANAPAETGLPIGNLSSQFFANVYLNELDQFIKHQLKARAYVRYVDDFVLLHPDPAQLVQWRTAIEGFLAERLHLRLRDAGRLAPVRQGIDFLGYIVRPRYCLVRRRVVGHLLSRLDRWRRAVHRADGSLRLAPAQREALHAMLASYLGHFRHARIGTLLTRIWARHAWLGHWLTVQAGPAGWTVHRCDGVRGVASLAGQWRGLRRRHPRHALLMQVGTQWECTAPRGHSLPQAFCHTACRRPGLHGAWTLPARQVAALQAALRRSGQPWCEVVEHGWLRGGLKHRQVRAVWPAPAPATAFCNTSGAHT